MHFVFRRRIADELPRVRGEQGGREAWKHQPAKTFSNFGAVSSKSSIESGNGEGYSSQDMDLEIQRVARELYKAFSGLNEEFERPQDQVGE